MKLGKSSIQNAFQDNDKSLVSSPILYFIRVGFEPYGGMLNIIYQ